MAIHNASAAVAGVSLATGLVPITNFSLTGLFRIDQAHVDGEVPLIEIAHNTNVVEVRYDAAPAGEVVLRTAKYSSPGEWEQLIGTEHAPGTWVGIGMSCSGTGAGLWTICFALQSGTYLSFSRELGGLTFTPAALRFLHGSVISTRGAYAACQNVKYGTGALNAAQMAADCWSLANQNTSVWTPLSTPMASGSTAAIQAGTLTVVGAPVLTDGYFTGATSGTAPTIAVASATITGDAIAVAGTLVSASSAQTVNVDFLVGATLAFSEVATVTGTNWAATSDNIPPGTYSIRARIQDSNGTGSNLFATPQVFVGVSGESSIPYTYTSTAVLLVPASASIPTGSTATFKAINQAGIAIAGALVSVSNAFATAPSLTDKDGNVVVTGVSAGASSLVASIMNQAGSTLFATAPLTIGAASASEVTVTPSDVAMFAGQTQQFTSVISGGGTTLWAVQSGLGSIDANGLYTAPATATTAVVRGTKSGFPTVFDESTIVVSQGAQSGIGSRFLGNENLSVSPGESFSWQIRVEVDGVARQGAVITTVAVPTAILIIANPLATSGDGTTTITAQAVSDIATGVDVEVTFGIVAGSLSAELRATVSIADSEFGYLVLRGRSYPRPYKQN